MAAFRVFGSPATDVTPELGRSLARSLGRARAVLMASHGGTVTGRTVADLAVNVICLTKAIEAQRAMAATGWPVTEPDRGTSAEKGRRIWSFEMADVHWSFWVRRDGCLRAAGAVSMRATVPRMRASPQEGSDD